MRGNSKSMPRLSAKLDVEVKLVYAEMRMMKSGLKLHGKITVESEPVR